MSYTGVTPTARGGGSNSGCFVLDNLLFALGMARSAYVARICDSPEDMTPSMETGLAMNDVASYFGRRYLNAPGVAHKPCF